MRLFAFWRRNLSYRRYRIPDSESLIRLFLCKFCRTPKCRGHAKVMRKAVNEVKCMRTSSIACIGPSIACIGPSIAANVFNCCERSQLLCIVSCEIVRKRQICYVLGPWLIEAIYFFDSYKIRNCNKPSGL